MIFSKRTLGGSLGLRGGVVFVSFVDDVGSLRSSGIRVNDVLTHVNNIPVFDDAVAAHLLLRCQATHFQATVGIERKLVERGFCAKVWDAVVRQTKRKGNEVEDSSPPVDL